MNVKKEHSFRHFPDRQEKAPFPCQSDPYPVNSETPPSPIHDHHNSTSSSGEDSALCPATFFTKQFRSHDIVSTACLHDIQAIWKHWKKACPEVPPDGKNSESFAGIAGRKYIFGAGTDAAPVLWLPDIRRLQSDHLWQKSEFFPVHRPSGKNPGLPDRSEYRSLNTGDRIRIRPAPDNPSRIFPDTDRFPTQNLLPCRCRILICHPFYETISGS